MEIPLFFVNKGFKNSASVTQVYDFDSQLWFVKSFRQTIHADMVGRCEWDQLCCGGLVDIAWLEDVDSSELAFNAPLLSLYYASSFTGQVPYFSRYDMSSRLARF
ncbi:hypothetical protein V6N13_039864 [Hibiscus sabdariffa]|uniref:Uncharacterized protein n=1 Tax=Hibiscus sabdariffa TaxID=183260 RepID=A0ABR2SU54_9ROSI